MERTSAASSSIPDTIFMASSLMLSRLEIEAAVDLRASIEAKAENLRKVFIEATIEEINKRGWASL